MMKVRKGYSQPLAMGALGFSLALLVGGCSSGGGSSTSSSGGSGGSSSSKSSSGGSSGGSSSSSKSSSGGSSSGGSSSSSKSSSGGSSGGSSSGGSSSGGSSSGGSSSGGSSSGGSSSGGSSSGGSSSGGSSSGGSSSGGAPPAAGDLKCKDPIYGDVTIPQAAIISDFENNSLMPYATDGRAKGDVEGWRAWAKEDGYNPEKSPNTFKIDSSVHGPCSAKGALHITSAGPNAQNAYAAFGVDIMGRTADKKKQVWDASKYTGVGFWAKCAADLPFAFLKVVDGNQDADIPNATCSYDGSTKCVQHGIKNAVITKDWTYYKIYFKEALQDPNGGEFTPKDFDPSKFIAFQVNVNPFSPRSGAASANKFDCYVDDVHFLSEAAPTTPAETVTWSVSGTKINRNGKEHKIRGLVRPSMEWDYAGFGITREDAQRIKAWKPNAVRLAVKDTLWKGASTGSATGNGASYQLHVKRAVNWYLQQGMDVILDLHYVGGSPSSDNASWWDTISKDKFFQDGRIIYELFNEPTDGVDSLRTWANGVISKVRANGAKNLILASGPDYTYDLSGFVGKGVTDSANASAYAVHPYIFKKPDPNSWKSICAQLPVVATEFGDANVEGLNQIAPDKCEPTVYQNYIDSFESIGMSWTSWAWIVDAWGCGFPQIIQDWSGTPNSIGKPVHDALVSKNGGH